MQNPKLKAETESEPANKALTLAESFEKQLNNDKTADSCLDKLIVRALSVQAARHEDAAARIENEGLIVDNARDQPEAHPALAIERAASKTITDLAKSLKEQRRLAAQRARQQRHGS